VVGDLMEIAREIRRGSRGRVAPLSFLPDHLEPLPVVPLGELEGRCYLVFQAADRPGVLGQIASVLGDTASASSPCSRSAPAGSAVPVSCSRIRREAPCGALDDRSPARRRAHPLRHREALMAKPHRAWFQSLASRASATLDEVVYTPRGGLLRYPRHGRLRKT
jgi:hypothetical protein